MSENRYMTLNVFRLDSAGRFVFSGLHQDILIYRETSGVVEMIDTAGIWVGVNEGVEGIMKDDAFDLDIGDMMLLFTDGITEATDAGQQMFPDEKFHDLLKTHGRMTSKDIKQKLIDELQPYHKEDDVAFVIVKRME